MSLFDGGDGGNGWGDDWPAPTQQRSLIEDPPTLNPDYWRTKLKQEGDSPATQPYVQAGNMQYGEKYWKDLGPIGQAMAKMGGDPRSRKKSLGSRIGQGIVDNVVDAGKLALNTMDAAQGRVYDTAIDTIGAPPKELTGREGQQHWDELSGPEKFLAQLAMMKVPGLMTAKSSPVGPLGPGHMAGDVMGFQNYTGEKWAGPASDITKLARSGRISDEEAQRAKTLLSYLDDQNIRIQGTNEPIGGTVKGDFRPGWRSPSEIRVSSAYGPERQNGTLTHELGHHLDWDKALTNWTGRTEDQTLENLFAGANSSPVRKALTAEQYRFTNPQEWVAENVREWADKNFTPPSVAQNAREVMRSINNLPIRRETAETQKILDQLLRAGKPQPSQEVLGDWLDSILTPGR